VAATKPSSENVYSIISLPEAEAPVNLLGDSGSPSEITLKMQKEAETFFSAISDGLPQSLIGLTCMTVIQYDGED
jgi:hypothetical protein